MHPGCDFDSAPWYSPDLRATAKHQVILLFLQLESGTGYSFSDSLKNARQLP